ncbi:hypothetical protein HII31_07995 [Pseudocercospora fuligena]|uniref:Uncharacterized protein n=1 Tax=Pseudocercospora fuligena TaxID=685502 RepID=A0A8H6RIU7_9PEZI|nr:hypothetical protein HII31_07995 [Pseudocercospora fuligena]
MGVVSSGSVFGRSRNQERNPPGQFTSSIICDLFPNANASQLDVHAPDAREQMRAIAARLIHCVLATTYNDISIYHATISPQDSPDEENDDLKNRCELFGEVTEVLIDRLEEALDQHEQELQAISRLNRQAAALQAARSDVERQQAEIKKQEEDLKAEWENARGEAQERAGEDHLDASKHLDALTMMRREFLRGMSDDLGEKGEADHKEEETNTI